MTEREWLSRIAEAAQSAANAFNYLPSVLIAQTAQETGYGSTDLSQPGIYNTVGMKVDLLNDTWTSDYWHGGVYAKKTPEWKNGKKITVEAEFRVYDSYYDGLADFCQFLRDAKLDSGKYKYRDLLGTRDPWTLIEGVRSRGYCTDPEYSRAIMDIIKKHNLTQYDVGVEPMREIIDITSENRIPRPRGDNPLDWIVVHYLGVPNADNPYIYTKGNTYGYGGHYNVTIAGKIYKAVDPRKGVVYHCGGGLQGEGGHQYYGICDNWNSIGVECGCAADTTKKELDGDSNLWYFTEETQDSAAWLVAQLMHEHGIGIDHVIRHYDVTGKICPNPYVLNNRRNTSWTWEQFKERVKSYLEGAESVREGVYMTTFENVHKGTNGADALTVQRLLFAQDYKGADGEALKLDGDFGANSEHALKVFQKYHGLTVDGDCGPNTWAALLGK